LATNPKRNSYFGEILHPKKKLLEIVGPVDFKINFGVSATSGMGIQQSKLKPNGLKGKQVGEASRMWDMVHGTYYISLISLLFNLL
jgi:hypothetical protein